MAVDQAKRGPDTREQGAPSASKEGDFLGSGGKRISDAERDMFNTLSAALEIAVPTA